MPLYREENQSYIHYRKGSVAMYALRDFLGVEAVNRALRRLVELRAYSSDPYTLSTDFLTLLREEADPEHGPMIEDLFERITLYDLELVASRVEELPDGRFKATLDVEAKKLYASADGTEKEAPLDLAIDIGLFRDSPASESFGSDAVLFLEKRPIRSGRSEVVVVVDSRPAFAGIDPYNKLIDRDSDDNLAEVDAVN
jgi:hypothetical protein